MVRDAGGWLCRPVHPDDLDWMHALNQAHATALSSLTKDRLRTLVGQTFHAAVIDPEAAFLLSFHQDAAYDSANFLWFRARLEQFVYIDRVVVAASRRREGLAHLLYEDLFEAARSCGQDTIVCEVNREPPNPASDRFHAALGFDVIGEAVLPGAEKAVRYLVKCLD